MGDRTRNLLIALDEEVTSPEDLPTESLLERGGVLKTSHEMYSYTPHPDYIRMEDDD